ncbi:hypothetical protein AS9A_P10027 (plasmid) [Hoyosella subflava DQS3-9A1]|uniref:Uncharacterized protein n=1 Tax=Hoyosella subflava (strain DSM 45089 / JCM 17490 / NBRC 109087 / DQS3-9A1) TaxID=443218 RepID=F6ESC3_HOYSD|nr:hypothetical protein AS9A_P10027 [Hoyosella subflava DQS3-9A1]
MGPRFLPEHFVMTEHACARARDDSPPRHRHPHRRPIDDLDRLTQQAGPNVAAYGCTFESASTLNSPMLVASHRTSAK